MASKTLEQLCQEVKDTMPAQYRENCWYLVTTSVLIACGKPEVMSDFYIHLTTSGPEASTAQQKAHLSYRLRDVLMKEWTLVGIPAVIVALTSLAKAEGPAEMANKGLSTKWKDIDINKSIPDRGTAFMQSLYKDNLAPIFASWGSHLEDFEWMEKSVIYGLFLSDHSVLDPVETEMVVLISIMCQGMSAPTYWHLRGLRRLGVSEEDVEAVQRCVEAIAKWCGRSVDGWPRVSDVKEII